MPTITDKSRPDLSPYLIHFTSGNDDEAFESLVSILETKTIQQSNYKCYGQHISCYTETPIQSIQTAGGFVNWTNYTNYSQFGILLRKEDLYNLDTRPVFNCAEKFHEDFPKHLKWRCKKFEPKFTDKSTDFAWEREWRKIGDLDLRQINYEVIVPNETWGNKLSDAAKEKGFQILAVYQL